MPRLAATMVLGLLLLGVCHLEVFAGGPLIEDASLISNAAAPMGELPMEFHSPICARLGAGFGYLVDPFTGRVAFHIGLDFLSDFGAEIRAAAPGMVVAAERRGPYGLMVEIDHGQGYKTRYGQLQMTTVKPGDVVAAGQPIATVGSSGRSYGPHLHFEVHYGPSALDPRRVLKPDEDCAAARTPNDKRQPSNDVVRIPEVPAAPSAVLIDRQRNMRFAWPVCTQKHTGFGYRTDPYTGRPSFHSGLDLGSDAGVAVRAGANGRVIAAEVRGPYGLMIEIDHGYGYRTRYGHLQSARVRPGDLVARGQTIGAVGTTGRTLGPHLHFEVWFLDVVRDPSKYLEDDPACAATGH